MTGAKCVVSYRVGVDLRRAQDQDIVQIGALILVRVVRVVPEIKERVGHTVALWDTKYALTPSAIRRRIRRTITGSIRAQYQARAKTSISVEDIDTRVIVKGPARIRREIVLGVKPQLDVDLLIAGQIVIGRSEDPLHPFRRGTRSRHAGGSRLCTVYRVGPTVTSKAGPSPVGNFSPGKVTNRPSRRGESCGFAIDSGDCCPRGRVVADDRRRPIRSCGTACRPTARWRTPRLI